MPKSLQNRLHTGKRRFMRPVVRVSFIQRQHISILLGADDILDGIMLNGLISFALKTAYLCFNYGILRMCRFLEERSSDSTLRELDLSCNCRNRYRRD